MLCSLCPGQTNFTFNEVLPCIPWHVPGIGNASAPKNVSVTAFCCQTHCCHLRKEEKEETARLPKLVEELDSVKEYVLHALCKIIAKSLGCVSEGQFHLTE